MLISILFLRSQALGCLGQLFVQFFNFNLQGYFLIPLLIFFDFGPVELIFLLFVIFLLSIVTDLDLFDNLGQNINLLSYFSLSCSDLIDFIFTKFLLAL